MRFRSQTYRCAEKGEIHQPDAGEFFRPWHGNIYDISKKDLQKAKNKYDHEQNSADVVLDPDQYFIGFFQLISQGNPSLRAEYAL